VVNVQTNNALFRILAILNRCLFVIHVSSLRININEYKLRNVKTLNTFFFCLYYLGHPIAVGGGKHFQEAPTFVPVDATEVPSTAPLPSAPPEGWEDTQPQQPPPAQH
jgi:hypothetical protein